MKGKGKTIAVVLLVFAGLLTLQLFDREGNINNSEKNFLTGLKNYASYDKVKLTQREACILIDKKSSLLFECGNEMAGYPAEQNMLTKLPEALKSLTVQHQLAEQNKDSVMKLFAVNSVKLSFLTGDEESSYEFAGDLNSEKGFYARKLNGGKNIDEIYKLRSTLLEKNFEKLFSARLSDWRSVKVCDFQQGKIERVHLTNHRKPEQSFSVRISEGKIELFDFDNLQKDADYPALVSYLQSFKTIVAKTSLGTDFTRDSCIENRSKSLFTLKVQSSFGVEGEEITLKFNAKCAEDGAKAFDGSLLLFDPKDMYLEMDNETFIIPYIGLEDILIEVDELLGE